MNQEIRRGNFFTWSLVENCEDKLSTFWITGSRSNKLQAMSKAFSAWKFWKIYQIRRHSSHKPHTTAVSTKLFSFRKTGFKSWLWIFKQHICNLNRGWIFWFFPAKWIDVNYCVFFNIDDIALEINSVKKKYTNQIFFLFKRL